MTCSWDYDIVNPLLVEYFKVKPGTFDSLGNPLVVRIGAFSGAISTYIQIKDYGFYERSGTPEQIVLHKHIAFFEDVTIEDETEYYCAVRAIKTEDPFNSNMTFLQVYGKNEIYVGLFAI